MKTKYAVRAAKLATMVLLLAIGCHRKQEILYNGMPLNVWGERLASSDPEVRVDALRVLTGIGEAARPLEQRIRTIARSDAYEDIRVQAVVALDSMHTSVSEFNDLMAKYSQPIIPQNDDENDAEQGNVDTAMQSLEEHASTEDDLNYLKETEETPDSGMADTSVMPQDSIGQEAWRAEKQTSELEGLRSQLREPRVLANLLITGDLESRRFAAHSLAGMAGTDDDVRSALETGSTDSDSLVRAASKAALEYWTRP